MSAATSVDGRPVTDGRPAPRRRPTLRRRQRELVAVVVVASAVVAATATAHGLLVPAGTSTPLLRIFGAFVAVAAGGALLRIDGPAQATSTLAVVGVAAALTAVATFPPSQVTWTPDPPSTAGPEVPGGAGDGLTDVILDQPGPGAPAEPADVTPIPGGSELAIEDGQVVLAGPDGTRTVLGDTEELRGRQLQRPDGTRIAVGDGALLEVPAALPAGEPSAPGAGALDGVLGLLLGCFALLAFAPPVVRFAERAEVGLVDRGTEPEVAAPLVPRSVEEGLSDVLRAMLADPDPRTAVIGAYAQLLAALAAAGAPRRPEEGPHEHLWRSLGPLGIRRGPLHRLAELFVQARFTPRPVTAEHREAAIAALADALGDLRLASPDLTGALVGAPA